MRRSGKQTSLRSDAARGDSRRDRVGWWAATIAAAKGYFVSEALCSEGSWPTGRAWSCGSEDAVDPSNLPLSFSKQHRPLPAVLVDPRARPARRPLDALPPSTTTWMAFHAPSRCARLLEAFWKTLHAHGGREKAPNYTLVPIGYYLRGPQATLH